MLSCMRLSLVPALLLCLLSAALPAAAQSSRCANCHLANLGTPAMDRLPFMTRHYQEWEFSPHARHEVGCERCHGGDASTFERTPAHRGVRPSRDPASPTHWANLPRTCGTCHTGPFVLFERSRHAALLAAKDPRVPTCSTCHGDVGARLLSPAALEQQCNRCHGPGRAAPRPERAANARLMLEGVLEVRALLDHAHALVRRVSDGARRTALEDAWRQAEVPLIEARQAGHAFVFDELEARLSLARQRTGALLDRLANPVSPLPR